MAYIGKEPASGIRSRFIFTATAGQTTFSGADDESRTLNYTDGHFTDVFLNGVKLDKSDYTATSGTSVVLDEGAAASDILEVVAYDTFSVFNGEFSQDVTIGADLTVDTNTLHVDSTNNRVGIGTTSPTRNLHVNSGTGDVVARFESTDADAYVNFVSSGGEALVGSSGNDLVFYPAGTEEMRVTDSGKVGIGTSSPSSKTSIIGTGVNGLHLGQQTDNNGNSARLFYDNSTNIWTTYSTAGSFKIASGATIGTTSGTDRLVINSSGNVGIGTSSPNALLDIEDTTPTLRLTDNRDISWSGNEELGKIEFYNSDSSGNGKHVTGFIKNIQALTGGSTQVSGDLTFGTAAYNTAATERMRIDSSGNLLVSKTAANTSTVGVEARENGLIVGTRSGGQPLLLDRLTNDGDLILFRKDSANVGSIGVISSRPYISTPYGSDSGLRFDSAYIAPCTTTGSGRDNAIDLGSSGNRFDDIYATNGTIQTSDQNEKQQIASLTDAEITAAKAISKLFKTFKWNDKVEAKGDAARTHAGVIAQDVQQAMTDAGLDAGDYAFFISTTWWETQTEVPAVEADEENGIEAADAYTRTDTYDTAEEAPEGATERTRLGIRYPELLAFVGAATEQRLADIETRIAALEAN